MNEYVPHHHQVCASDTLVGLILHPVVCGENSDLPPNRENSGFHHFAEHRNKR